MEIQDDNGTKSAIDNIEELQYKVLTWVKAMKSKNKDTAEINALLTIYYALEDMANVYYHIYKGKKMLKYLKKQEVDIRHNLSIVFEYEGESDSQMEVKPWRSPANSIIINDLKKLITEIKY